MKKFFLFIALGITTNSLAVKNNFIEIDIKKMDYQRPDAGSRDAGILNFNRVQLSWDGMNVGINNKESLFNSKITYKKSFLNFNGKHLNLGFKFDNATQFELISDIDIEDSSFIINSQFFSFAGKDFVVKSDEAKLGLNNFNLYCSGESGHDLTSFDGIVAGCLTNSFVSGKDSNGIAGAEISYNSADKEGEISLSSKLDSIEMKEGRLNSIFKSNSITLPTFKIETADAHVSCKKDPDLITADVNKLVGDCLNSIEAKIPALVLKDGDENTKFNINLEKLSVDDKKLNVFSPFVVVGDETASTNLKNVRIKCFKSEESEIYDAHKVMGGCFSKGRVTIGKITSIGNEEKAKTHYEEMMEDLYGHRNVEAKKVSKTFIKDIEVDLENGYFSIYTRIKVIFNKYINLSLHGSIDHYPEEKMMVFHVKDTKLPFGLKLKDLVMSQLKKNLVSSSISFKGHSIYIGL